MLVPSFLFFKISKSLTGFLNVFCFSGGSQLNEFSIGERCVFSEAELVFSDSLIVPG